MNARQFQTTSRDVRGACGRHVVFAMALWPLVSGWGRAVAQDATDSQGAPKPTSQAVVVVVGAEGAQEYAEEFRMWADHWKSAANHAGAEFTMIGADPPGDLDDRTRLEKRVAEHATARNVDVLWVILIGHGTFDGDAAKFNLRGPDVSAKDLSKWLSAVSTSVALIDCTSASGPLLVEAAAANRIVIVATKSGFEANFARFGRYLAEAINDPHSDLDKDDQVSLLEAYLTACRGVAEFYESEGRLATEHALLDDNGDGLGTPADWFRGLRATQRAKEGATLDGVRAHQLHLVPSRREAALPHNVRERRDALELAMAKLREDKAAIGDEKYYGQLEPMLIELARLYEGAGQLQSSE